MDHVMDHIKLKTAAVCLKVNTCFFCFENMSFVCCYWFKVIFAISDVLLFSAGAQYSS